MRSINFRRSVGKSDSKMSDGAYATPQVDKACNMKRLCTLMVAVLMMWQSSLARAVEPWIDVIDSSRATQWSTAGASGGIPNRTTACATLSPGATVSQINSAIANCPNGQYVFLSEGTYNLGGGMITIGKSNVTVRGAGADRTKLVFSNRGNCGGVPASLCISGSWIQGGYGTSPQSLSDWTAGYAKGSTEITLSSTSGLSAGTRIILEQLDDTSDSDGVYVCGTGQVCGYTSHGGDNRGNRFQRQIVLVESINGNNVTLSQPLHMPNWRANRSPTARWSNGTVSGSGFEDLSIDLLGATNTRGQESNVAIVGSANSWVKGIRSVMADRSHVMVYQSTQITVRDSYFYGSYNGVSTSYGVETFAASSSILVENNVFQHNTNPLIINDGGSGSVYGYNFSIDNYRADVTNLMSATFQVHSPGTGMILVEGMDGLAAAADNWYGTVHFVTFFRNHLYGDIYNNPSKSAQTQIFQIAAYSRFFNFIGNVLGRSGYYKTYEPNGSIGCGSDYIFCFGYAHANGGVTDSRTKPTAMRWGNYDTVSALSHPDGRFLSSEVPTSLTEYSNSVPNEQSLPASMYLTRKPDWWGSAPWPAIGPDIKGGGISGYNGHANKIPARNCWERGAIDSAYGSRNVIAFNADTCYGPSTRSRPMPPSDIVVN